MVLALQAQAGEDAGAGMLPRLLTLTPIDEVLSFLGSVGALGAAGEALRLAVGVT